MVAAAAIGRMVQLRMRPRLLGSTMSAGRDDLNSVMMALGLSVRDGASRDRLLADGKGRAGHTSLSHELPNEPRRALHATVENGLEVALVDKADDHAVARSTAIDKRNNRHREASISMFHTKAFDNNWRSRHSLSLSLFPPLVSLLPLQGAPRATVTTPAVTSAVTPAVTVLDGRVCSHLVYTACKPVCDGVVVAFYGRFMGVTDAVRGTGGDTTAGGARAGDTRAHRWGF